MGFEFARCHCKGQVVLLNVQVISVRLFRNFIFSLIYFSLSFRFLENKAFRRNDLHVSVQDAETIPKVEFFKREENGEKGEKVCTLSIVPTPQVCKFLKSFCYHSG